MKNKEFLWKWVSFMTTFDVIAVTMKSENESAHLPRLGKA
jgi:hypothetical protein